MNAIGRAVAFLLATGAFFGIVAAFRGRIDGAAALALVLILSALAITVWAATNRKRNKT